MELAEDLRRLGIRVLRVLNGSAITEIRARQMALEGRGKPGRWPKAALEASISLLLDPDTRTAALERGIDPDKLALALSDAAFYGVVDRRIRTFRLEERMGVIAQSGGKIHSLPRLKVKTGEINEAWRKPRPKGKAGKAMRADVEKTAFEAAETVIAALDQGEQRAAGYFMKVFLENASDRQIGKYVTGKSASKAARYRFAIIESRRLDKRLRLGAMFYPQIEVDSEVQERIDSHRDEIDALDEPKYDIDARTLVVRRGLFSRIGTDEPMPKRLAYGARSLASVGAVFGVAAVAVSALVLSFPLVSVPAITWLVPAVVTAAAGTLLVTEGDRLKKKVDIEEADTIEIKAVDAKDEIEEDDTVKIKAVDPNDDVPTSREVVAELFWEPFAYDDDPLEAVQKGEWAKKLTASRPFSQLEASQAPDLSQQQQQTQLLQPAGRGPQQAPHVQPDEQTQQLLARLRTQSQLRNAKLRGEAAEAIGRDDNESDPHTYGVRILEAVLGRWLPGQAGDYDQLYTDACRAIARVRTDPDAEFTRREVHAVSTTRSHNAAEAVKHGDRLIMVGIDKAVGAEKAKSFKALSGPEQGKTLGG